MWYIRSLMILALLVLPAIPTPSYGMGDVDGNGRVDLGTAS